MGFSNGKIAKVWEINKKEKFDEVKISTSKKNKDSGDYEQDFSSYVRFIGKAHEKVAELSGTEMIKLLETDTTNKYDKDKKITYTNHVCYDFEIYKADKTDDKPRESKQDNHPPLYEEDDDNLPF